MNIDILDKLDNKYDRWLFYEIFINEEYKPIKKFINNANIRFDIWAYKWFFSLYLLANWYTKNLVLVEPIKEYLSTAKNLIYNFVSKNNINIKWKINFINAAIKSKYSPNRPFYIHLTKGWHSWFYLDQIEDKILQKFFIKNNKLVSTPVLKILNINDLINFYKFNTGVGIKLDVEWEEIFLILEKNRLFWVDFLVFEYHLFNETFEKLFDKNLQILKTIFKTVKIYPSKYTNKIWLCLCYKWRM